MGPSERGSGKSALITAMISFEKLIAIFILCIHQYVHNVPSLIGSGISGGHLPIHSGGNAGQSTIRNPDFLTRSCSNRFPSCRRVKNCKVLQSGSANQEAQESCRTTSGASVNKPCIFPFKYRGVEYNRCILVNSSPDNNAWCSTEVDIRGNHVGGQGKWGYCGPACPK